MLKGAHLGIAFDMRAARLLNLDYVHVGPPLHQRAALEADYGQLPRTGLPLVWQASDLFGIYTPQQIQNIIAMPNFCGHWIIGNEPDKGFGSTAAQTPHEYAQAVIDNMLVILPLSRKPRRFTLALGSKEAIDNGYAWCVLDELQRIAPGIFDLFASVAVNYYSLPLDAWDCVHWLHGVYSVLEVRGLGHLRVILKEVGAAQSDATQAQAAEFITNLFHVLRKRDFPWLYSVEWFAADDLAYLGMPYVPLLDSVELTAAGKAWAEG